jgi:S-adenosylmethionine hydrolase
MSSRRYDTVSFLSDFGHGSDSVGIIKSILRDLAPDVVVIDIAHDIAPFDVRAASLALARAVPYLPEGIIITSVDPGAGGSRRIVAVEIAGGAGIVIGPDNGLIATGVALAGGADRAVVLDRDEHHLASPGATFVACSRWVPRSMRRLFYRVWFRFLARRTADSRARSSGSIASATSSSTCRSTI